MLWVFLFLRLKCDVVYSFFYSLENVRFASWLATKKKCRHIVHIADHSDLFFNSLEFKSILNSSYKRACIGQNMKDAYQKKFNLEFEVFHNYADTKNLPLLPTDDFVFNTKYPFKILFLGSLFSYLHNGAINDLCNAVTELNDNGHPIVFNLYGQKVPSDFLTTEINGKSVVHHGQVPTKERFNIMQDHHAFVVPSTFDSSVAAEYCFSIPTKLPELLASGKPTIVYGPDVMEAHRFCSDKGCGYLIDERSVDKLKTSLVEIMENYREQLTASIAQSKEIQHLISKSSQIPRLHDFLLT
jgi:glycosyltransferase involved in cell wall biosynthesis